MHGRFKKLFLWIDDDVCFAVGPTRTALASVPTCCLGLRDQGPQVFLYFRLRILVLLHLSSVSPSHPLFFALSVRYLTKPNGFFSVLLRENRFAFFLLCFFLSRSPLPRSTAHQFSPLPPPLSAFAGSAFILTSPSSSLKGIKVIAQMITQTSVAMETRSCDRDRHASSTTKEPISKPAMES